MQVRIALLEIIYPYESKHITILLVRSNHKEGLLHISNEGNFVTSESNEKVKNELVEFGTLVQALIQ